jgi:hypothetical protein
MILLGLLLGLVGTDVNTGTRASRSTFRSCSTASTSCRWRWACSASPKSSQPRTETSERGLMHAKVQPA